MTYDEWKAREPENTAADEAEATKEAQSEAEEALCMAFAQKTQGQAACMALAQKIQAMPLAKQLRLSLLIEREQMSLHELFAAVCSEAAPGMVKVTVNIFRWAIGDLKDSIGYEIYAEGSCYGSGLGLGTAEQALALFRARERPPAKPDESLDVGF